MEDVDPAAVAEAHAEAIWAIRKLLVAELSEIGIAELADRFVEIRDLRGKVLVRVPFREAVGFDGRAG